MSIADCGPFSFVVGLLGSLHCLGMCGPLVFACSLPGNPASQPPESNRSMIHRTRNVLPHLMFHLGRLTFYSSAGALAAGCFTALQLSTTFHALYSVLAIGCGGLLVVFGLIMFQALPLPSAAGRWLSAHIASLVSWVPSLIRSPKPTRKYVLGLMAGCLPCCLSWSMIVTVAATRRPMEGLLTMIWFGLGTLPALLAAAFFGKVVSLKVRLAGEKLAALSVCVMGTTLVLKGVGLVG